VVGRRLIGRSVPLLMATLLLAFGCTPTPKPAVPGEALFPDIAQLWSEPTDIAARDLFHGPGDPDLMPLSKSVFTLIAKDDKGFSPGYHVRDLLGRQWSVKYGPEAQSEVVASRITWAVGYHQPPIYHVADWQLIGADVAPDAAPPARFAPSGPACTTAARGPGRATRSWGRSPTAA